MLQFVDFTATVINYLGLLLIYYIHITTIIANSKIKILIEIVEFLSCSPRFQ